MVRAEPLPTHVQPMLAVAGSMPAQLDRYAFEYKWDGVRVITYWDGSHLCMESRNRIEITHRYPELADLAKALGRRRAVLDGEVIAIDQHGRPSFGLLQQRMLVDDRSLIARRMRQVPVVYMLFDLLYVRYSSIMDQPWEQRRSELEKLELDDGRWKAPPVYPGEGPALMQVARASGLEGLIAKELGSPYQPGQRSRAWIKIKLFARQEFVVGGYLKGQGSLTNSLGSLLVGYYDLTPEQAQQLGQAPRLLYAGSVGSGFTDRRRRELQQQLDAHQLAASPFANTTPRGAIFVQPTLVAEVEFREWTSSHTLRQPSFKGIRDDKAPHMVVREPQASTG